MELTLKKVDSFQPCILLARWSPPNLLHIALHLCLYPTCASSSTGTPTVPPFLDEYIPPLFDQVPSHDRRTDERHIPTHGPIERYKTTRAAIEIIDKMESIRSALQPVLQPITHNLPAPIRDFGASLLGEQCYANLVLDIDVTDVACLKLAVSKALGLGIVAASSVVKVPQVLNLVRARSAAGVSALAYLLETTSYLVSLAYNARRGFPFSTYGETACILVQNVVITVLVLRYSGRAGAAALLVAALAAAGAALFLDGVLDLAALGYLQAGAGALGVASKLPQIMAVWQEGGTGQLSAFTVSPPKTYSHA